MAQKMGIQINPRKMGRPFALDPDIAKIIIETIERGNDPEDAVAAAGISRGTFFNWMKRGMALHREMLADEDFVIDEMQLTLLEFYQGVQRARAQAKVNMVNVVTETAQAGNAQSAQWWLERTDPKRWGKRQHMDIEQTITVEDKRDQLRKLVRIDDPEARKAMLLLAERTADDAEDGSKDP